MSVSRVLIGGGTGFVGRALSNSLHQQGIQTCIVSRMPNVQDCITWEELAQKGIPDGIDAVVNASGQNVLDPKRRWTSGFQQNVIASRVETNRMLSNAIQSCKRPPKVFISMSGVGYYPPDPSKEYTEDSKGGDADFFSKLCTQWEKACLNTQNTRTVVIRGGVVLGRKGGMIKEMYPLFWLGLGAKLGSGKQFMPWIHEQDLTNVFIEALRNDKVAGIINGVAPQLITNEQFTKAFARSLWRPTFLSIPEKVIEIMFAKDRAAMMTKGQKVICKRLQALNFKFQYPDIDSAMRDIVR